MPTLHLLGTGGAVTDPHRTTTMLAFSDGDSTIAVDCGGDLVHRLLSAGLSPDSVRALIITHEHPDHVSGFPLFMEKIWLHERRRPIPVFGPKAGLAQARRIFETFDTSGWEGLPEIEWNEIELEVGVPVLDDDTWRITGGPAEHGSKPTLAIRVESKSSGTVVAYSADTAPSDKIAELAKGADVLVHEANGHMPGTHSSAKEAAGIAAKAGAGRLLLVHLPPGCSDEDLAPARQQFRNVEFGEEGGRYEF
jgi:ribonuclease Z